MDINECLERGYLVKIKSDKYLIKKEIEESEYDFDKAKKSFDEEDYKWSIIMSYYTMFHSARALLFSSGYREKRHFVISIFLEDLNKKGKIEKKYINYFNAAISSREDADYHYSYSIKISEDTLQMAEDFKEKVKEMIENGI